MLPAPIVDADEVALIDEAAVSLGHDIATLMEGAGTALADEAERIAGDGTILVVCGGGNNGGDGYVAARLLAERGREVVVFPVKPAKSELCRRQAASLPDSVQVVDRVPATRPALIVDAILGAGVSGAPRDPIPAILAELAGFDAPCLAADMPTGTGTEHVLPHCRTITFQVAKRELLDDPRVASHVVADIGIDPRAYEEVMPVCLRRFPPLREIGHKGDHGELLVVGGGRFPGACEFATRVAVRAGCDLVRAWTAGEASLPPTILVDRCEGPVLQPDREGRLEVLVDRAGAVLIGPGAGRGAETDEALAQAYELALAAGKPVVIDADGLTALAAAIREHAGPSPLLLTPHAGEARAVLDRRDVDDAAVHGFARENRVILRKGPVDLISDGRRWQRNPRGNPRMAVGGSGDCLAGLAAGLCARGASPYDAARIAAYWVTTAADELWLELGPCYDALDLIAHLPETLARELRALDYWPPVGEG